MLVFPNWWQRWSRGRKVACAGVAAGLLVVGVGLWIFLSGDPGSGRLLDGTRVRLEQATYGTNHVSPVSLLAPWVRRLPAKWRDKLGWRWGSGRTFSSSTPMYTFWIKQSRNPENELRVVYAIVDEHGLESPMIFNGPFDNYLPQGFGSKTMGVEIGTSVFPRKSASFFLRLYQSDGKGNRPRVAEFRVRNVAPQTASTWTARPLPLTERTNQFAFVLTKATVGGPAPGPLKGRYANCVGEWCEFRFRVTEDDRPAEGWRILEIWISEESGNQVRISGEDVGSFNGQFYRQEGDEIVCVHRWEFWADQPAWKVRVHFLKPGTRDFWAEYVVRPEFLRLRR